MASATKTTKGGGQVPEIYLQRQDRDIVFGRRQYCGEQAYIALIAVA
jgi:hypothetical protein